MVTTDEPVEPAAQLLSRARAGDAQAFCKLIEPLQPQLLRQAIALSGDLGLAEDLVSETLVEGWKSLARFDGSCRLSTWLCAILLHRCHRAWRRAKSRPQSLSHVPLTEAERLREQQENVESSEPSPAESAVSRETGLQLQHCLEALPAKHREVILLRFFEDASLPEIAASLGCSAGTVKSRLFHALEKLRKMKMNLPGLKGDKPI